MLYGCNAYFTNEDLKDNQTQDDMILQIKDKMEQSFFESLIKGKVTYVVKEKYGKIEVEGTLDLK